MNFFLSSLCTASLRLPPSPTNSSSSHKSMLTCCSGSAAYNPSGPLRTQQVVTSRLPPISRMHEHPLARQSHTSVQTHCWSVLGMVSCLDRQTIWEICVHGMEHSHTMNAAGTPLPVAIPNELIAYGLKHWLCKTSRAQEKQCTKRLLGRPVRLLI